MMEVLFVFCNRDRDKIILPRIQIRSTSKFKLLTQSFVWGRRSGVRDRPIVIYDYAPSRAGSVAENFLWGFSGYLQAGDYAGYHAAGRKDDISHVGCWAHARSKFIDAQKAAKDKKTARIGKADVAINYIAKLYAIEHRRKTRAARLVTS
jgi:transposase